MNIHNIALVRCFGKNEFNNILKNDGVMKTENKIVVLKPGNTISEYASGLDRAIEKKGAYDLSEIPSTFDEYVLQTGDKNYSAYSRLKRDICIEQLRTLIPLRADYNAELLWAINGIVPDDQEAGNSFAGNVFSENDYAIVYGLEEVMSQPTAEVRSLMPTDTAIIGEIKLDSNATLIIRNSVYKGLTEKEKEDLNKIGIQIIVFDGELKKAVDKYLDESDRFVCETPSLQRGTDGFLDSPTKAETLATLRAISGEFGIPFVYHREFVSEELDDYTYVFSFYLNDFFHYLESLQVIDFDYYILENYPGGYAEEFGEKVVEFGIDKYRAIVQEYNSRLQELKEAGKLPTPEEMLEAKEKGDEIQVYTLIKESRLEEKKLVGKDELRKLAHHSSMEELTTAIDDMQKYMDEKNNEEKPKKGSNSSKNSIDDTGNKSLDD